MKKLKLMLAGVLILLIPVQIFSSSSRPKSPIHLQGKVDDPEPSKRPSPFPPIEAFLTETSIQVDFYQDSNCVGIEVTNSLGEVVYSENVMSGFGLVEIIDISPFESGTYTITFTNSDGMYLWGEFEL